MHDDNNLKIASWVVARLNGTIQQEEEKMLEEWIHESDEHRLFYERLVERNYLMGRLQEYENYSLEALKERVMFSVGKQGKRIRLIRRVKQIAAILLIPLIAGSVFLFMMEIEEISPFFTRQLSKNIGRFRSIVIPSCLWKTKLPVLMRVSLAKRIWAVMKRI